MQWHTNIYTGNISRGTDSGKAQLFAVKFDAFNSEDTPLVYLIDTYENESTHETFSFQENDTFAARVWVTDQDNNILFGGDDGFSGVIALIPETEE